MDPLILGKNSLSEPTISVNFTSNKKICLKEHMKKNKIYKFQSLLEEKLFCGRIRMQIPLISDAGSGSDSAHSQFGLLSRY
jgi:hypothetical protein